VLSAFSGLQVHSKALSNGKRERELSQFQNHIHMQILIW
jgi:hypothetical protein